MSLVWVGFVLKQTSKLGPSWILDLKIADMGHSKMNLSYHSGVSQTF